MGDSGQDGGIVVERLAEVEDELDATRERAEDLETRLSGLLLADAERDTGPRTQAVEGLLQELDYWIVQNPSVRELLPSGYAARVSAQLALRPRFGTYVAP